MSPVVASATLLEISHPININVGNKMPRPVGEDLSSTTTAMKTSQMTAPMTSNEEQRVQGKKKRRHRRKSRSRKMSTAVELDQDAAGVTEDQSPGTAGPVATAGLEEKHEAAADASATGEVKPVSAGPTPTFTTSLAANMPPSSPVPDVRELELQRPSITTQQHTVPTLLPQSPAGAGPEAGIHSPSTSSSKAKMAEPIQRKGSVLDESRPAPRASSPKASSESRLSWGSPTERIILPSWASPSFSSVTKRDCATNTVRWMKEESEIDTTSGSRTDDKYTQTGDVIMYPRRSPFDKRRLEVTRFVSPDESLSDNLGLDGGTSYLSSSTTPSPSASNPAPPRRSSMSKGALKHRITGKEATVPMHDSDSTTDKSGSEKETSLTPPKVKQELPDTEDLPERKPTGKYPAERRGSDVVDMIKNLLIENAAARSGAGRHDVEHRFGTIAPVKVPLITPKATSDEGKADVRVGEFEEFYEEVAEETLNGPRRPSIRRSSRERLNVLNPAVVSDENTAKDAQRETGSLKGNSKCSKRYFRRERRGPVESLVSETSLLEKGASDDTRKTLPSGVMGEMSNARNTAMTSNTGASNKQMCGMKIPNDLNEVSSAPHSTTVQHDEDNPQANFAISPSSQSAGVVHCPTRRNKDTDETPTSSGQCGKSSKARTPRSKDASQEFRLSDPRLNAQPYSAAQRPFGCICDDLQDYPQNSFIYSPPNLPFQFSGISTPNLDWTTTSILGSSPVYAVPWPPFDMQSDRSRPQVRNLNFEAIAKDRTRPTRGYEDIAVRAEKVATKDSRCNKATLRDSPSGTTRNGAHWNATPKRSTSLGPKQHISETDDLNERTLQMPRRASATSVASERLQASRKASTVSTDSKIIQPSRKASAASVHSGILHTSRKPSATSSDFTTLQTSRGVPTGSSSTRREAPDSTSRLRSSHVSAARHCQSHNCHQGAHHHHHCEDHSHCRSTGALNNPPSPQEEPMTTADGRDAALVRLEQLLREQNRLLLEEKQRRDTQLRVKRLLKERDKLLSTLGRTAKEGQGIQNSLTDQDGVTSSALAALDLTPGGQARRRDGQREPEGADPVCDDNTACSVKGKSPFPRQAKKSPDCSPGKSAQRRQGNSPGSTQRKS